MFNSLVAATAGIFSIFGGGGGQHQDVKPFRPQEERHATSTAATAANIACVAAAVDAREAALDTGVGTFASDINAAYTARKSALATAYAQTDPGAIRTSVKTAWKTFAAALRLAGKNWKTVQRGAWEQFKTAVKACGPGSASVVDSTNANAEISTTN